MRRRFFRTFATENQKHKLLYYYERNNKVHHVHGSHDDDDYDNRMFK